MKIISVINYKGGVGKTATTHNLGYALSLNHKVLLIDLDPQGNLSERLGVKIKNNINESIDKKVLLTEQVKENLFVTSADIGLASLEYTLQTKIGGISTISQLLKLVDFDYVLIDCPPSVSILTQNALFASNQAIICVDCRESAANALPLMYEVLSQINVAYNPTLTAKVLFTKKVRNRNVLSTIINNVRENYICYDSEISENIKLEEANRERKSVLEFAPDSNVANDYLFLSKEL